MLKHSLATVVDVGVHAEEELPRLTGIERAQHDDVATFLQRLAQEDAATVLEVRAADHLLLLVHTILPVVLYLSAKRARCSSRACRWKVYSMYTYVYCMYVAHGAVWLFVSIVTLCTLIIVKPIVCFDSF